MSKIDMIKIQQRKLTRFFKEKDISFAVIASDFVGNTHFVRLKPYINTMTAIERLDKVFGIDRWETEVEADGKTIVGISIKSNDKFVTRHNTVKFLEDQLPGALEFGIGRYLIDLSYPKIQATIKKTDGYASHTTPERTVLYFKPPPLPDQYLPAQNIRKEQLEHINDLVENIGADPKEYLESLGVHDFKELDGNEAKDVISTLEKVVPQRL